MQPIYPLMFLVFSLFTIVRFQNDICSTSSGNNGTCYTKTECMNRGGIPDGTCATGFGVCCQCKKNILKIRETSRDFTIFFLVSYQCGSSTSENGTYFSSPAPPQRICNLLIHRVNDDICQVMLSPNSYILLFFREIDFTMFFSG